ncbi:MAG: hypothetical protein ACFCGT_20030 [Sandaracinaceae bacterium]
MPRTSSTLAACILGLPFAVACSRDCPCPDPDPGALVTQDVAAGGEVGEALELRDADEVRERASSRRMPPLDTPLEETAPELREAWSLTEAALALPYPPAPEDWTADGIEAWMADVFTPWRERRRSANQAALDATGRVPEASAAMAEALAGTVLASYAVDLRLIAAETAPAAEAGTESFLRAQIHHVHEVIRPDRGVDDQARTHFEACHEGAADDAEHAALAEFCRTRPEVLTDHTLPPREPEPSEALVAAVEATRAVVDFADPPLPEEDSAEATAAWAQGTFTPWVARRREVLEAMAAVLAPLNAEDTPSARAQAAALSGVAYLAFASDFRRIGHGTMPELGDEDAEIAAIYLDTIERAAEPLATQARAAYDQCVSLADEGELVALADYCWAMSLR